MGKRKEKQSKAKQVLALVFGCTFNSTVEVEVVEVQEGRATAVARLGSARLQLLTYSNGYSSSVLFCLQLFFAFAFALLHSFSTVMKTKGPKEKIPWKNKQQTDSASDYNHISLSFSPLSSVCIVMTCLSNGEKKKKKKKKQPIKHPLLLPYFTSAPFFLGAQRPQRYATQCDPMQPQSFDIILKREKNKKEQDKTTTTNSHCWEQRKGKKGKKGHSNNNSAQVKQWKNRSPTRCA